MEQVFKLLYKDKYIGSVLIKEINFPDMSGSIRFYQDILTKEKELQDYIDFSVELSEKVLGDKQEYEAFIEEKEWKHQSLIDSLDWMVISDDDVITKILTPVFFRDNEVNFRVQ